MSPLPYGVKRFTAQAKKEGVRVAALRTARIWRDRPLYSLRNRLDEAKDRRIAGRSLEEYVTAITDGAVDTISTPYGTLDVVLSKEKFTKDDVLLDVGCGVGRPLAYLVGKRFPGKLVGIEINSAVAEMGAQWALKYPQVSIIAGDAFDHDLTPYTVFFTWKAMTSELFQRFVLKMEAEITRPVRFIYVGDQHDGDFMTGRPGWALYRRDWVQRVHGLPMHAIPQRYSVWQFDPSKATQAV